MEQQIEFVRAALEALDQVENSTNEIYFDESIQDAVDRAIATLRGKLTGKLRTLEHKQYDSFIKAFKP